MLRIFTNTAIKTVYICGEFCDWDIDKAIEVNRTDKKDYFYIPKMPIGEYKVFDVKSFLGTEINPVTKQPSYNRFYGGKNDEVITAYFKED